MNDRQSLTGLVLGLGLIRENADALQDRRYLVFEFEEPATCVRPDQDVVRTSQLQQPNVMVG